MTTYALYCVHRGVEHYLQSAPALSGVRVTRGKVLNWLDSMGVQLSHEHTTLLVIYENGKPLLQAPFGPPTHAWRPYQTPEKNSSQEPAIPTAPAVPVLQAGPSYESGGAEQRKTRLLTPTPKPQTRVVQRVHKTYDQLVAELAASLAALDMPQTVEIPVQTPQSG